MPGPPVPVGSLSEVHVAPDGSVWVAGWASIDGQEHAAVFRHTGHDWERLTTGLEAGINGNTLVVLSESDAWLGMNSGLAHFDGTRWSRVSDLPADAVPSALEAVGPDDIWLAGIDHASGTPAGNRLWAVGLVFATPTRLAAFAAYGE